MQSGSTRQREEKVKEIMADNFSILEHNKLQ
jgi:hypothetical protein